MCDKLIEDTLTKYSGTYPMIRWGWKTFDKELIDTMDQMMKEDSLGTRADCRVIWLMGTGVAKVGLEAGFLHERTRTGFVGELNGMRAYAAKDDTYFKSDALLMMAYRDGVFVEAEGSWVDVDGSHACLV